MLVPMPIVDDLVVDMSSPQLISGESLVETSVNVYKQKVHFGSCLNNLAIESLPVSLCYPK